MPAPPSELFVTAEDGAQITAYISQTTATRKGVVLLLPPGLWHTANQNLCFAAMADLVASGYDCIACNYRVDQHMNWLPGQTVNGIHPTSMDDVRRMGNKILTDGRFTGVPWFIVGGSTGGYQAEYMAYDTTVHTSPVAWDTTKRPSGVVSLSGATDLSSNESGDTMEFFAAVDLYANVTDHVTGAPQLLAASPITFINASAKPSIYFRSQFEGTGTFPGMPPSQKAHLDTAANAVPLTNYSSFEIPGNLHAFNYWSAVKNQVTDWLDAIVGGGSIIPPPPPIDIPHGVSAAISDGDLIDASILANPDIVSVSLTVHWNDFETADNTFDFTTYLLPQIKAASAAGKDVILRPTTMGGSAHFNGNTPDHVFTAIGLTPTGKPGIVLDGVTTSGSPTVTAASGAFSDADLHRAISGTNIPASSFIGIVNGYTSIGLSSSNTVNTPVNATGNGTGISLTITGRPQVSATAHTQVPGVTYDYLDGNPQHGGNPETTIPVFWNPTYLKYKKRMLATLGDWVTNTSSLTQQEKASIKVIAVAYANAQTEDWNIPNDSMIDTSIGQTLSHIDLWLNLLTEMVYANRGMGYTTQQMIDGAVKTATESFTDGQTFSNKRLVSSTAFFTQADVGKSVSGTNIAANTKIKTWTSYTEVQLDTNTVGTGSAQSFTITFRDSGIFDVAAAAFPGQAVTTAIGSNGKQLDKDAAVAAGDPDIAYFLPRTVQTAVIAKYPTRMITQVNSVSAIIPEDPGTTRWKLLHDMHALGGPVAGQALWFVSGDTSFRMNGGDATDKDNPGAPDLTETEILVRSGSKLFTYSPEYYEVYGKDCIALLNAINQINAIFNGGSGPPPPPVPGAPFQPIIRVVNLVDDTIGGIGALLGLDLSSDLPPAKARNMIARLNTHVRFAHRYYDWPELTIIEERAFRTIWNADDAFVAADEVLYIPTFSYFKALIDVPVGTDPTETNFWAPLTLTDRYILRDQQCRMSIGDVYGVWDASPLETCWPLPLYFRPGQRGIEVRGGNGTTAWVSFKIRCPQFTSDPWFNAIPYKAGQVVLGPDGNCYVALRDNVGIPTTVQLFWMLVPMPEILNQYCIYRTAADLVRDGQTSAIYKLEAAEQLNSEIDKLYEGGGSQRYQWGARTNTQASLYAGWCCSPNFNSDPGSVSTLTDVCLDRWGNIRITS